MNRFTFQTISCSRHIYVAIFLVAVVGSCASEKETKEKTVHELPFNEINLHDLTGFQETPDKGWVMAENIFMDRLIDHHGEVTPGRGVVVNKQHVKDQLITRFEHGDLDFKLDFMLAKNSDAYIFLQGCYGLYLNDSWLQDTLSNQSNGLILTKDGHELPEVNVSKAPGLWQHLVVKFKAPRFDSSGKKVRSAAFKEVILNGKVIHQNVDVNPSQQSPAKEEKLKSPLVIASNSGRVAFRDILYKHYDDARIRVEDIHYFVYKGLYKKYDTLNTMIPLRTGTVDSIYWAVGDKRAQVEFKGKLEIPVAGDYVFRLKAGGPAWLLIDQNLVVENRGTRDYTDAHTGRVKLNKGTHSFEIIYANFDQSLVIDYEGPQIPFTRLTSTSSERLVPPVQPLLYTLNNKPGIQRGFFTHQGKVNPYAICIGFPEGLNYAYDLTTYSVLDVWRGKFIDVAQLWRERGESQMIVPLGAPIALPGIPSVLQLNNSKDPWVDTVDVINNQYSKRGYRLDSSGLPVFMYAYKGLTIEDHLLPASNHEGWVRNVTINTTSTETLSHVYFLLGSGRFVEKLPNGDYTIDDKEYYISAIRGMDKNTLVIEKKNDRFELLLPLMLRSGDPVRFSYSIIW